MIRRRVAIASVIAIGLVYLAVGFGVVQRLEARLITEIDEQLESRSARGLAGLDKPDGHVVGRQSQLEIRHNLIIRMDALGAVVSEIPSGPLDDPHPIPDISTVDVDGDPSTVSAADGTEFRVVAVGLEDGGAVISGVPLDSARQAVADARELLVLGGVIAVVAIAGLIWVIVRRGLSPLDEVVVVAERIVDGHLDERAPNSGRSEVDRLSAAMNQMLDHLAAALRDREAGEQRVRRFAADASHELRTPLTSIRGYAELYRSQSADVDGDDCVARIERESIRVSALVDQLLALARFDDGQPLQVGEHEVADIVADAVDEARTRHTDRVIECVLCTESTLASIDGVRLRQLVDNLIANSIIHAGPDASVTVRVERRDPATVRLVVADDGVGMTTAEQAHAFERFWRAAPNGPQPGTGLGLAIVDEIAGAHGGTVHVDSEPDVGTTVTVTIPAGGDT